MIDLPEIEIEIAKISNYQGMHLVVPECLVGAEKMCRKIAAKGSSFIERVGA